LRASIRAKAFGYPSRIVPRSPAQRQAGSSCPHWRLELAADAAPHRAWKVGDIQSFPEDLTSGLSAVLEANRNTFRRFLAARRVHPDEIEDILQEIFLRIRTTPTGPISDPLAYLYRIADNLVIDLRRSQGRRATREQTWTATHRGFGEADTQPSAEETLIGKERLTYVRQTLLRLPERTLLIFRRFRLEGVGQKEIAADLGISVSAVEKHLQRAYRALLEARSKIDEDLPPA
jgi:RNA polymerase sigma factor (sigma-70 family)